jgi:hypothetical protein
MIPPRRAATAGETAGGTVSRIRSGEEKHQPPVTANIGTPLVAITQQNQQNVNAASAQENIYVASC